MRRALAEDPVAQGNHNADTVNKGNTGKGQLCVEGINKAGRQRSDHTAQRFGRIVKAHNQIFLSGIRLVSNDALQHRNTDGVAGINQNAPKDEHPDLRCQQSANRRKRTYPHKYGQRQPAVCFLMIQTHNVVLNRKVIMPTAALMMPL